MKNTKMVERKRDIYIYILEKTDEKIHTDNESAAHPSPRQSPTRKKQPNQRVQSEEKGGSGRQISITTGRWNYIMEINLLPPSTFIINNTLNYIIVDTVFGLT